jgi:hypothetical protein
LYRVAGLLPGFGSFRAPVQGWFVVTLGLAILAAAGAAWMLDRWKAPYMVPLLLVVVFCDVWYWNSWTNPLAYARSSFDELYGNAEALVQRDIASTQPPLSRFEAPPRMTALGPLNHPLDLRLESTYGYVGLELRDYSEYVAAMQTNRRLADGLNVSRVLNLEHKRVDPNPSVLPRASFPGTITEAVSIDESRRMLAAHDPSHTVIVVAPHPATRQDASATASIVWHDEQGYRIRYKAASPSLLRLSVPYFPGWHATVNDTECAVVRADHALTGIIVPAGENELTVRFRSNYFGAGAAISVTALLLVVLTVWRDTRKKPDPAGIPATERPTRFPALDLPGGTKATRASASLDNLKVGTLHPLQGFEPL